MDSNTKLDKSVLWTVRTAVEIGDDYNLPKAVGVNAIVAKQKHKEFSNQGLKVIYYPYFVAKVSGVLDISSLNGIVLEYCIGDLWNLVTYDKPQGRYIKPLSTDCSGIGYFNRLFMYAKHVHSKMKVFVEDGLHIYLEWSIAHKCNLKGNPVGKPYIVFYEFRVID